jgi:pantetheine-phosphate adenylyltransferase
LRRKIAVYAGSFDPFTNGHLYVYEKAAELFDEVIVVFATNPSKSRWSNLDAMKGAVEKVVGKPPIIHDGLVADYCEKNGIEYLVRGLRDTSDFLYEEAIAKFNAEVNPDLKTIYFRAKDDGISSTAVRLMHENGRSVEKYCPRAVLDALL